jgi:GNAT superfamily N-acetyltransferase
MANREHSTTAIRQLRSDEVEFLREMLYTALDWRPESTLPPVEWVLAHPQVSIFHEGWGRLGDVALIAEVDDRPVGLVWYRYFTEEAHGEGFVDKETPELAIAVVDGYRGRGIGRSLMNAAHERARNYEIARISLSVDAENPAKRMYESLGYIDYEPEDGLGRMVLGLQAVD